MSIKTINLLKLEPPKKTFGKNDPLPRQRESKGVKKCNPLAAIHVKEDHVENSPHSTSPCGIS